MELPCDPAIPLMGMHLKESQTLIGRNISTPMSIAQLSTIAKIWKRPKCPLVDERIKKLRYVYTVDYYLAVKRRKSYLL